MARFLLFLMLTSCATVPLRPAPEQLQPWTTTLRDQQSDTPFAVVYRIGTRRLVFVGAQHENMDDSPTFQMIRQAYAAFKFDVAIAEGFPTSLGPNPRRILDYAAKSSKRADGFVEGGETIPTISGAQQQGAVLWGGEADDADIKAQVVAAGFSAEDLLGFYVLRNIPQWIGERNIADADDARLQPLVADALTKNREHLEIPATVLAGYSPWADWYKAINGKAISASFVTEEVGPLSNGPFGTNKVAYAVSRARDAHLHRLIIEKLNAKKSVLVVFGGSHLIIHRPALDAVLGKPCYEGVELSLADDACR